MKLTSLAVAGALFTACVPGCDEGLRIRSATEKLAAVELPTGATIQAGTCLEVRRGDALLGFLQVSKVDGTTADCEVMAGKADPSAIAIPILPCARKIALLTDEPKGKAVVELSALYPGLVVTDQAKLGECDVLVCAMADPAKAKAVDFSIIENFTRPGRTAIVSLHEYAHAKSAKVETIRSKTPLQFRIERITDLTKGMTVGQTLNWYGTEGEGDDQKKKDKLHLTLAGLPESKSISILATSTSNGHPIFVEEKIGGGRIIAMDLVSPNEGAGYDAGSKNKWVFPGNILGRAVGQSTYRTEKLKYEDFVNVMKGIVDKHKGRIEMKEEGKGSADDPTYSLLFGNAGAPRFLIIGAIHGGEWKNSYALLDLIEMLLYNRDKDYKIDWLLRNFSVKLIPILNVAGYSKHGQVNKNDCDLNRNFPFHWEEFKGDGGWRAKYPGEVLRGKAPFSEAESQIVKRIVEGERPIGLIDLHMHNFEHGHMICCPHKEACTDLKELQTVKRLIDQRLRNRYLFGSDKQLQLRGGGYGSGRPFLVNWAGTLGIPSTVFESAGGWEDSLPHGDVVIEDCLNFMYVIGVNHLARK